MNKHSSRYRSMIYLKGKWSYRRADLVRRFNVGRVFVVRVKGLGFRVQGLGFTVQGLGFSPRARSSASMAATAAASAAAPPSSSASPASSQGLTLVHVRAQLQQLQDTFMS